MFCTGKTYDLAILVFDTHDKLVGILTDVVDKPFSNCEYYLDLGERCNPNLIHVYIDGELISRQFTYLDEPVEEIWVSVSFTDLYEDDECDIYEKALDKWGERAQVMMFMEESAELTKELSKYLRSISDDGISELDNEFKILSEMADVYIILEQLKYMFEFSDEMLEDEKQDKLKKLKTYLEDGE